jgi:hypothetical protein
MSKTKITIKEIGKKFKLSPPMTQSLKEMVENGKEMTAQDLEALQKKVTLSDYDLQSLKSLQYELNWQIRQLSSNYTPENLTAEILNSPAFQKASEDINKTLESMKEIFERADSPLKQIIKLSNVSPGIKEKYGQQIFHKDVHDVLQKLQNNLIYPIDATLEDQKTWLEDLQKNFPANSLENSIAIFSAATKLPPMEYKFNNRKEGEKGKGEWVIITKDNDEAREYVTQVGIDFNLSGQIINKIMGEEKMTPEEIVALQQNVTLQPKDLNELKNLQEQLPKQVKALSRYKENLTTDTLKDQNFLAAKKKVDNTLKSMTEILERADSPLKRINTHELTSFQQEYQNQTVIKPFHQGMNDSLRKLEDSKAMMKNLENSPQGLKKYTEQEYIKFQWDEKLGRSCKKKKEYMNCKQRSNQQYNEQDLEQEVRDLNERNEKQTIQSVKDMLKELEETFPDGKSYIPSEAIKDNNIQKVNEKFKLPDQIIKNVRENQKMTDQDLEDLQQNVTLKAKDLKDLKYLQDKLNWQIEKLSSNYTPENLTADILNNTEFQKAGKDINATLESMTKIFERADSPLKHIIQFAHVSSDIKEQYRPQIFHKDVHADLQTLENGKYKTIATLDERKKWLKHLQEDLKANPLKKSIAIFNSIKQQRMQKIGDEFKLSSDIIEKFINEAMDEAITDKEIVALQKKVTLEDKNLNDLKSLQEQLPEQIKDLIQYHNETILKNLESEEEKSSKIETAMQANLELSLAIDLADSKSHEDQKRLDDLEKKYRELASQLTKQAIINNLESKDQKRLDDLKKESTELASQLTKQAIIENLKYKETMFQDKIKNINQTLASMTKILEEADSPLKRIQQDSSLNYGLKIEPCHQAVRDNLKKLQSIKHQLQNLMKLGEDSCKHTIEEFELKKQKDSEKKVKDLNEAKKKVFDNKQNMLDELKKNFQAEESYVPSEAISAYDATQRQKIQEIGDKFELSPQMIQRLQRVVEDGEKMTDNDLKALQKNFTLNVTLEYLDLHNLTSLQHKLNSQIKDLSSNYDPQNLTKGNIKSFKFKQKRQAINETLKSMQEIFERADSPLKQIIQFAPNIEKQCGKQIFHKDVNDDLDKLQNNLKYPINNDLDLQKTWLKDLQKNFPDNSLENSIAIFSPPLMKYRLNYGNENEEKWRAMTEYDDDATAYVKQVRIDFKLSEKITNKFMEGKAMIPQEVEDLQKNVTLKDEDLIELKDLQKKLPEQVKALSSYKENLKADTLTDMQFMKASKEVIATLKSMTEILERADSPFKRINTLELVYFREDYPSQAAIEPFHQAVKNSLQKLKNSKAMMKRLENSLQEVKKYTEEEYIKFQRDEKLDKYCETLDEYMDYKRRSNEQYSEQDLINDVADLNKRNEEQTIRHTQDILKELEKTFPNGKSYIPSEVIKDHDIQKINEKFKLPDQIINKIKDEEKMTPEEIVALQQNVTLSNNDLQELKKLQNKLSEQIKKLLKYKPDDLTADILDSPAFQKAGKEINATLESMTEIFERADSPLKHIIKLSPNIKNQYREQIFPQDVHDALRKLESDKYKTDATLDERKEWLRDLQANTQANPLKKSIAIFEDKQAVIQQPKTFWEKIADFFSRRTRHENRQGTQEQQQAEVNLQENLNMSQENEPVKVNQEGNNILQQTEVNLLENLNISQAKNEPVKVNQEENKYSGIEPMDMTDPDTIKMYYAFEKKIKSNQTKKTSQYVSNFFHTMFKTEQKKKNISPYGTPKNSFTKSSQYVRKK